MNAIASDPDETYVSVVNEFSDLDALIGRIVNATCREGT